MQIREATALDVPGIVNLLRASLGESVLPKSEKIWRYKHFENPFGNSLVLIAILQGEIIGVRAFMCWKWHYENEEFQVYRSVDTGTHPQHQGKGIFRSLNMKAVEIAKKKGRHFIFNTPNAKSLPGNLKLGWKKMDKIKLSVYPSNPFHWFKATNNINYEVTHKASDENLLKLTQDYNKCNILRGKLFTPKSSQYLRWRYENNPLQKYEVIADKEYYLSAYIKEHKYFRELRITEHLFIDKSGQVQIKKEVKRLSKKFGATVITFGPEINYSYMKLSGNFGPVLTFRNLCLNEKNHSDFMKLNKWNYTLGDLELF